MLSSLIVPPFPRFLHDSNDQGLCWLLLLVQMAQDMLYTSEVDPGLEPLLHLEQLAQYSGRLGLEKGSFHSLLGALAQELSCESHAHFRSKLRSFCIMFTGIVMSVPSC